MSNIVWSEVGTFCLRAFLALDLGPEKTLGSAQENGPCKVPDGRLFLGPVQTIMSKSEVAPAAAEGCESGSNTFHKTINRMLSSGSHFS